MCGLSSRAFATRPRDPASSPRPPERGERLGIGERGGPIVGVGGEQLVELVVGLERQQPERLPVAQPLVVGWAAGSKE